MTGPSTRRLAAVLIADVAGYSRLMEQDEAGTHARLSSIRAEVTDPAVRRHGGRIVRSVGDGILVEFPSAVSALEAAIDIQRTMAERNRGLPAPERIDHRIGINLGDILVEEHDIAGTGVNVAARLESLAVPGGIAISGTVRQQVRQDLGVRFIDGGRHRVKNISRPIRVFHVDVHGDLPRSASMPAGRGRWWAAAAGIALALGVGAWFAARTALPEAAPQSLVVLPFDHPATPPEMPALASALTQQVTGAMSQLTGVSIIAPAVAAAYAAHRGDIRRIGRELAVRYALDGRVERDGGEVRVAVHVVDTASGSSLWSGSVRAPVAADGGAPLALVGPLADALRAALRGAELKRVAGGRQGESAYAVALGAIDALERSTEGAQLPGIRAQFERALALDPQHVPALTGYAHTLVYLADLAADAAEAEALLRRADEASLRAVTLQPDSAEAWAARANVLYFRDQFDAAAEAVRRGLQLNPYLMMLHAFGGQIDLLQDRGEQALAAFDRSIELNPGGPQYGALMHHRCRALLMLGRLDAAIQSCERGMAFGAEWADYMLLAAAYALQGDPRRAAHARDELLRLKPDFTIGWHERLASGSAGAASIYERVLHDGLRKAGVPE
jgi:class 3 adenylate cyclase/TolB-like protein/tetratricopeptide (TPR) repeat protein